MVLVLVTSCQKTANETNEEQTMHSNNEQSKGASYRETEKPNENYKTDRKPVIEIPKSPSDQEYQKIALSALGQHDPINASDNYEVKALDENRVEVAWLDEEFNKAHPTVASRMPKFIRKVIIDKKTNKVVLIVVPN